GGRAYPAPFVRHAWLELMKNHPHDSICGCSIDQVHREMMPRFAAVNQVADELTQRSVGAYARPQAAPAIFVYNPTGWATEAWVDVVVHWPAAGAPASIHLETPDGRAVETVIHRVEDTEVFRAEVDFNPDWFPVRRYVGAARVALPAAGGVTLKAVPGAPAAPSLTIEASPTAIENEHLKLEVVDGRVNLLDKATGERFADCHYFLDEIDMGDEYNFSPMAGDAPVRLAFSGCRQGEGAGQAARLEVTWAGDRPRGLAPDRSGLDARTAALVVTSTFELAAGERVVRVETRLDNAIEDHRLRVVTAIGQGDEPAVWADAAFGVFRREPLQMSALPVPKGIEAIMPEFPQQLFTALERQDRGLAVFNQGLPEASLIQGEAGWALATTLIRAVGWLSRDDLRTRGGGAGPRFPTPEAQCQGAHTFRYALAPYRGSWTEVQPLAHAFSAPALAWEAEGLPFFGASVALGDSRLVLSALKKADGADQLVVRVYNPTPEPVTSDVSVKVPHARLLEANMAEEAGAVAGTGTVQ
ncbi:MAG: glycosyl hydrolase-related protein, partial [Candidatus Sericytochromatia bacterium]